MMKYWTNGWNPIVGCSHISGGCDNCYAEAMAARMVRMGNKKYEEAIHNGHWTGDLHLDRDALEAPLYVRKPRVFFNSMCDPFHADVVERWIENMMEIIIKAKQHTFVICTKRAEWIAEYLLPHPDTLAAENFNPLINLYLGVTVENQEMADERLPYLAKLARAGWNTWISYEPALEPINWRKHLITDCGSIGGGLHQYSTWCRCVIAGGESGPNARPAHPDWFRACRDACADAGVMFAFKQWGTQAPGRILDGFEHWALPWGDKLK